MKKIFAALLAVSMLAAAAGGCAAAGAADGGNALPAGSALAQEQGAASERDISLSENHLTLKVGSGHALTATITPEGEGVPVMWESADTGVVTVSSSGQVTAVNEGSTTVTASIDNGQRAVCQVKVVRAVSDDGEPMRQDGYIYYEDFTKRENVPAYFEQDVAGLGRAVIEEGALRLTCIGGSNDRAFVTYEFDEPLDSGRYVLEARVRSDSRAFANLFFFFCDTQDFTATSKVVTNVAMEGNWFKNHAGRGWTDAATSYLLEYETGKWYDVTMALNIDEGYYDLTVNDQASLNAAFRHQVTGEDTAIRFLRCGTDNAYGDVSYEYIRIREGTDDDFADLDVNYSEDFDGTAKPSDLEQSVSGGGSLDFSTEGQVTLATPTSGTVSLYKQFDAALSGVVATEVRFRNDDSTANTFANLLFLKSSKLSGTSANIVTIAVESGALRYHNGSKWTLVEYNGNPIYLIDGAWYTLKAVNDYAAKTTKLYLSGETYKTAADGTAVALGDSVYLGEFGFRNGNIGNPDVFELAIGTGKAHTKFTVDYVKIYTVTE